MKISSLQLVLIVLVASCAAIFGVIVYLKLHDQSEIDSTSKFTHIPSVRTPYDDDGLKTFYQKLYSTEKNEWYSTTSEYDETDDTFASTTDVDPLKWFNLQPYRTTENNDDTTTEVGTNHDENDFWSTTNTYETNIFNHKHHTTPEDVQTDENDNWSTSAVESETVGTTTPYEGNNGWGIRTTTEKSQDYNEDLIDYNVNISSVYSDPAEDYFDDDSSAY